jgi:hypothetical protein
MKNEKLEEIQKLVNWLEGERQETEDEDFKKISDRLVPHRGFWPRDGEDKKTILQRGQKNINPASTLALDRATAGLTTGMTPEGQPWWAIQPREEGVMEADGVREHIAIREHIINTILREGKFYQAIHVGNLELFSFGGLMLFGDPSIKTVARFEECTAGTYSIASNADGDLDTVIRRVRRTPIQLKKKYGFHKLCKSTKEKIESGHPYDWVDVVHAVRPREDRDDTKIDNLNMMYESFMYEDQIDKKEDDYLAKDFLEESGYHEMPYFYAPYSLCGASEYGVGLGHLLVKQHGLLNETERLKVVALNKLINPPIKKPSSVKNRANVGAGQETKVSPTDNQGLAPLYEIPHQVYAAALEEISTVMERIAAIAKADLFYDLPMEMRPKDMTATEYMSRKRERLQQVAPFISLYEPRILDKVIQMVHNRADRAGMFPPPPPALEQSGVLDIVYISSVAKSLRQAGAESTRAFLADVGMLAELQTANQMKATVLRKVDFAQTADELHKGSGAPASILVDDTVFEETLEGEAQAEAAAMEQQQMREQAETAAKVGAVPTQGTVAGDAQAQEAL